MTPDLLRPFRAALQAADPYEAVMRSVRISGQRLSIRTWSCDLSRFDRIIVVGAGKGVAAMAHAMEELLAPRQHEGVVIVKHHHTRPIRMEQIEAGHPLPDDAGVAGTNKIIELVRRADDRTLIFCLLTGGGSSLLVAPIDGITLEDKQRTTDLLLKAGATITELNTVRKHLSTVKGGRLAELAHPATLVTLALSDVIGDRLDVIASGPTVADGTTFEDATRVIQRYNLQARLPERVTDILRKGLNGGIAETPKVGAPCFDTSTIFIVGGLRIALEAAVEEATRSGWRASLLTDELHGEARQAVQYLAGRAREAGQSRGEADQPLCLVSGGETTVTVTGNGRGGRNQELALAFALEIEGRQGITLLSAATDGTDGPTDAAGAIVDGDTAATARRHGLDPERYLHNNDSYTFFQRLDALSGERHHLITGPTGTNVMDVQIMLLDPIVTTTPG